MRAQTLLTAYAVLAVLGGVRGAAIIEDHTESYAAAKLSDSLAEAYDIALPDELFQKVLEECIAFENYEKQERARREAAGGGYVHGKGGTHWRPLFNAQGEFLRPRFAIEAAIQLFYKIDFGRSSPHPRVSGGEWWVQKRDLKEDIGFHHDKDEAMASLKQTMKFPEVSTVTYLTGQGAPTVIFNQTTPDGNGALPITPRHGVISYPKKNRHLRFQGNLQHGVPASLAPEVSDGSIVQLRGSGRERITFLVNWWKSAPMGPNCNKVTTKMAKHIGVFDREGVARIMASRAYQEHQPKPTQKKKWELSKDAGQRERFEVTVPGDEVIWFELPRSRVKGGCYDLRWRDAASGRGDGIYANICRLDLQGKVVRSLFHEERPKLIVFSADEAATLEWLNPMATEFEDELRFVIADPAATMDALRTFGLGVHDCPTAVIHNTRPADVKYLLPTVKGKRPKVTESNLRAMIVQFLKGRLPQMGGNDAGDNDE